MVGLFLVAVSSFVLSQTPESLSPKDRIDVFETFGRRSTMNITTTTQYLRTGWLCVNVIALGWRLRRMTTNSTLFST